MREGCLLASGGNQQWPGSGEAKDAPSSLHHEIGLLGSLRIAIKVARVALTFSVEGVGLPDSGEWPAPGSADTELGVLMEREMGHGETDVYAGVQARGCEADPGARRVLGNTLYKIIYRKWYHSTWGGQPPTKAPSEPVLPPLTPVGAGHDTAPRPSTGSAELLVLGSHGYGAFGDAPLGSVSIYCVHQPQPGSSSSGQPGSPRSHRPGRPRAAR